MFFSAAQNKFTYLILRGVKYYRVNGRELTATKSPVSDVEATETEAAKLLAKADEIKKMYTSNIPCFPLWDFVRCYCYCFPVTIGVAGGLKGLLK